MKNREGVVPPSSSDDKKGDLTRREFLKKTGKVLGAAGAATALGKIANIEKVFEQKEWEGNILDTMQVGQKLADSLDKYEQIKDQPSEWAGGNELTEGDERKVSIWVAGLKEARKKGIKRLDGVFMPEFTQKGFDRFDHEAEQYILDIFTRVNKGRDNKNKIKYILSSRKAIRNQGSIEMWDERGTLALVYFKEKDDKDTLKKRIDQVIEDKLRY